MFYSERRTQAKEVQRKKHFTQMSEEEIYKCVQLLRASHILHDKFTLTYHAKQKMIRTINFRSLIGMIHSEDAYKYIIEYNETTKEETTKRLLIKLPYTVQVLNVECYQFVVIDLTLGKIITTYYNKITDNHKTLDLSYYDETLKP